ncbi:MAG: xagB [Rickettsiales bacterium]|jgi:cellulose synthase/poly-beta-1,6-N-acetylglucosamine synthase-like glycosyltransferase|nr:xagB [Rickettsiales bacterium]
MERKLGELLLHKGELTQEALTKALHNQQRLGSKLGEQLIAEGKITNHGLYEALAQHYALPFVNLLQTPPNAGVLSANDLEHYLRLQAIPWKEEAGELWIATTSPNGPELITWTRQFGKPIRFVMTSPFDIHWSIQRYFSAQNDEEAREKLYKAAPHYSAKYLFLGFDRNLFLGSLSFVFLFAVYLPATAVAVLFTVMNLFYLATHFFKAALFAMGVLNPAPFRDVSRLEEAALPLYTLLIPLYKEEKTLPRLLQSIRNLDYPKHKLDVKLIVEANDAMTIEAIKRLKPESYFEIIRVPYSLPQTKPKACNYAIRFAKGEYVTIYDAEDEPESGQLKQAIAAFRAGGEGLTCVQAKLNYHNYGKGILPGLFALEYAVWFEFLLPGLKAMGMPIPLGGTSNHFRMDRLKSLHFWDPYNVTEDADAGMRVAWQKQEVGLIESITWEEAPVSFMSWLKQRSRWMKGYMQTYFVHMRHPIKLLRALGPVGFAGFQFFIGAPVLTYLLAPLLLLLGVGIGMTELSLFAEIPHWVLQLAGINLLGSIGFHALVAIIAVVWYRKEFGCKLLLYIPLFPFYWMLHSIASIRAVGQLITRPHYWEKTEHGHSIENPAQNF